MTDTNSTFQRVRELSKAIQNAEEATERTTAQAELREVVRAIRPAQLKAAATYQADYALCRDINHAWRSGDRAFDKHGNLRRTLVCLRCKTERHDLITRYGVLLNRRYVHPDGYSLPATFVHRSQKDFWRGLQYMAARRG